MSHQEMGENVFMVFSPATWNNLQEENKLDNLASQLEFKDAVTSPEKSDCVI